MSEMPRAAASADGSVSQGAVLLLGKSEVESYVKDGYSIYLVAGVKDVGKTEMLLAYQREQALLREGTFLPPPEGRMAKATPTAVASVVCYPVYLKRRKVLLVDASGERFQRLYPYLDDQEGEVGAAELAFLSLITAHLRGVALLIDLARLWQADSERSAGALQVEVANWILMLLRWLRYDGKYDEGSGKAFQKEVDRKLKLERRRLKIPVLVLFSRADELLKVEVPVAAEGVFRPAGAQRAAPRLLVPAREDPLLLVYHRLPLLYGSLVTHCDHFHLDFIHSLFLDPLSNAVLHRSPCGVRGALGWLLDRDWRWPGIPDRVWIALQRRFDRQHRWEVLPPSGQPAGRG